MTKTVSQQTENLICIIKQATQKAPALLRELHRNDYRSLRVRSFTQMYRL